MNGILLHHHHLSHETHGVNYPTAKDGKASGFVDSPNGNASPRFCLTSESVPDTDKKILAKNQRQVKLNVCSFVTDVGLHPDR